MDYQILGPLAVWRHPVKSGEPRARVLIVHGISEHSERHRNTIDALVAAQFEVIRFDLRGAGRSGGRRQWVQSFRDYVDDVTRVFNWICRDLEPRPLFLLGHSLGGAIAVHFAADYSSQLAGLILSAPAFKVGDGISPIKIKIGRMVARIAPNVRIPASLDFSGLSRDPDVGPQYAADPLACHFNTVRQGAEVLDALPNIPKLAAQIHCPLFLIHGTHDRVILLQGSYELFRAIQSDNKTFFVVPGGYHEPHNDHGKEEYFAALCLWLNKIIDDKSERLNTQPSKKPSRSTSGRTLST